MSEKPTPNLGADLQRIHRAISRGLTVAHDSCQALAASGFPDASTAEGFWKCCIALEGLAHAHHLAEDELFFPILRERLPDVVFDAFEAQHEEMKTILEEMKVAGGAASLDAMCTSLTKLVRLWHPHIEEEEETMSVDVAARVISVPETIELAQKAASLSQEHAQPAPLVVPYLLFNLEGADRAFYLAAMPEQVSQHLVPVVWKDEWAPMKPFLLD
jgi:hypothetical protein